MRKEENLFKKITQGGRQILPEFMDGRKVLTIFNRFGAKPGRARNQLTGTYRRSAINQRPTTTQNVCHKNDLLRDGNHKRQLNERKEKFIKLNQTAFIAQPRLSNCNFSIKRFSTHRNIKKTLNRE